MMTHLLDAHAREAAGRGSARSSRCTAGYNTHKTKTSKPNPGTDIKSDGVGEGVRTSSWSMRETFSLFNMAVSMSSDDMVVPTMEAHALDCEGRMRGGMRPGRR